MSHPFISTDELAANLQAGQPLTLLDIRFDPGKGSARERYLAGHIPGAQYVDLPTDLAGPKGATGGNLPLPDARVFEATARRWGIDNHSSIVAYDDSNGAPAARAAFVLRWAGQPHVRVLDGGLAAWHRASLPLTTIDDTASDEGAFRAAPGSARALNANEVAAFAGQLIDARPEKSFSEGRIPGAISLPNGALVDDHGRLLPADRLIQRLHNRGIDLTRPIAAYCGGGVASSFTLLALASLGTEAALYPGSWSDWISNPTHPIEK